LGAASPVLRALALEEYGLRWVHAPHVLVHLLPDGRAAVLDRDVDATAASVEAFAAGDGDRWRAEYDRWRRIGERLLHAMLGPFPPVRHGAALAATLRVAGALRLARLFLSSAQAYGEETFRGDGARLLVAGLALHTDLSPADAGSAAYGWLLAMLGQQYGFPVPSGGAARLVDALAARLAARGGEVVTGAPVDRVLAGQMTTSDPARSPAGTESMWAYTHLPHRDGGWPADVIAEQVDRVEAVVEAQAPGFRDLVVGRHVLAPGDLAAANPSLVGGAINGGTAAPYQQLVFRPVPGLGRPDTPV